MHVDVIDVHQAVYGVVMVNRRHCVTRQTTVLPPITTTSLG